MGGGVFEALREDGMVWYGMVFMGWVGCFNCCFLAVSCLCFLLALIAILLICIFSARRLPSCIKVFV